MLSMLNIYTKLQPDNYTESREKYSSIPHETKYLQTPIKERGRQKAQKQKQNPYLMRSLHCKTRESGTRRVMEQEAKAQRQTAWYVVRSEDGA